MPLTLTCNCTSPLKVLFTETVSPAVFPRFFSLYTPCASKSNPGSRARQADTRSTPPVTTSQQKPPDGGRHFETGVREDPNIPREKRYSFPVPPLSLTQRGEWQVPRPQLPPAPVAEFVAALGCGVVFGTKGTALRMNIIQIVRDHWVHILVPVGFVFGCYLDRRNDETLTSFRNKSLLFKRELRPNEEVTWK
ncbi:NADH dehydrogenase [ubiquinone] 1 beta subcomplex subunit 1 [Mustela lutreola]|uniref:NADH dehydrogenase [ubiquinone] 1 beta subcomplex subunit 1 n=1 Tax=Mustela lutreola TaxID=9666 RepID=UPI0027974D27|nr:NADH dehydrogenase [ubiquinone] 1 beta subcomplex subunit 1 [Mustela lutreola]